MFGAIAQVCQLDSKLKRGQIAKNAKNLLAAGYTPEQVLIFPVWWTANDWRGKRGDVPTIGQLLEKIKQSLVEDHSGVVIGKEKLDVIFAGEVQAFEVNTYG